MASAKEERQRHYSIPENFIEGGRVLNGTFKLRNFIEAIILGGVFALIGLAIPVQEVSTRITVVLSFALPPACIAIIGVNGDALSVFLRNAISWKRNHRIMIYNGFTQSYSSAPLDVMMAEDLPRDKLIGAYENWRDKQAEEESERRTNFVYEFEEDAELKKIQSLNNSTSGNSTKKRRFGRQRMTAEDLDLLVLTEEVVEDPLDDSGGFIVTDAGAFLKMDDDDEDFKI